MAGFTEEQAYQIGYGNVTPQIGYGKAQVVPNDMAAGIQRGIENFDVWQQRAARQRAQDQALKAEAEKRRIKRLDELKDKMSTGNTYMEPTLNAMKAKDIELWNSLINSENPDMDEIREFIAIANANKEAYDAIEAKFREGVLTDDISGFYSTDAIANARGEIDGYEVDISEYNPANPLSVRSYLQRASQESTLEKKIDPIAAFDRVAESVIDEIMGQPEFVNENTNLTNLGDFTTMEKITALNNRGKEQLKNRIKADIGFGFGAGQLWSREGVRTVDGKTYEDPEEFEDALLEYNIKRYLTDTESKTFKKSEGNGNGKDNSIYEGWDLHSGSDIPRGDMTRVPQTIKYTNLSGNYSVVSPRIKEGEQPKKRNWSTKDGAVEGYFDGYAKDKNTGNIYVLVAKPMTSSEQSVDLLKQATKKINGYSDMSEEEKTAARNEALVNGDIKLKTSEVITVPLDKNISKTPLDKKGVYSQFKDDRRIDSPEMANEVGYSSVKTNNGDFIDIDTAFMLYSGDKNAGESFGEWMFRTGNKFSDEQMQTQKSKIPSGAKVTTDADEFFGE